MPMIIAHPIALAAFAIIAIGVISYTIITEKKRKIPVRERHVEYVEDYGSESKPYDYQGVRKRHNANTEIKRPSSGKTESKNESSSRKLSNASSSTSVEKESLFNNLDSLDQNKVENSKIQNINQNIYQEDSVKLDFTRTVTDEDAESSVSNFSATYANDLASEFGGLEQPKSKDSSQKNVSEKLYMREVCEWLENEAETMSVSSHANSILSENDDEDAMSHLRALDYAVEKPVICKGCEECYANAVAQPCGHRYLCLDCAIKVHRIYKKCSVCNFYIKTYETYNSR